ncbi:12399_t:CDS:2, partial [Racocetra persica]
YSEEQVHALVPFQKSGRNTPKVNSIKEMVQKILKNDNLLYVDINEEASYIAYLDEVIDATKDYDITEESNRLQKIRQEILT